MIAAYSAAERRAAAASREDARRALELDMATTWTVDQYADHVRATLTVYADDTVDVYALTDGRTRIPVTEYAAIALDRLRPQD